MAITTNAAAVQSEFIPFWTTVEGESRDGKKCGVLFNADPKLEGMSNKQALYVLQNYDVKVECNGQVAFTVRTPDNVVMGFINNVKHTLSDKSKPATKSKFIAQLESQFRALELSDVNPKGMTEDLAAEILGSIPG